MSTIGPYAPAVPEYADVAPAVVVAASGICMGLPDAYEEEAWTGVRWMVRKKTFAHVLTVEADRLRPHPRRAAPAVRPRS